MFEVFIESVLKIIIFFTVLISSSAYLVLLERKICAYVQDRIGPNRVGFKGLLQPLADLLKLVTKEDIVPKNANKFIHHLSPIISVAIAFSTMAVIPVGDTIEIFGKEIKLQIADVNIGILYILSLTSISVYGIALSGWSSNNKYSLLGGLRSSAQMISYEISMGLAIIGVVMTAGSLELDEIVKSQAGFKWNIFLQPIGFIVFLVASFAETNRTPFDLPEAEPELVGGYHTEYSGLKFGLFFLAEYTNMIIASAIIVTLYFGGWQIPFGENFISSSVVLSITQIFSFLIKVGLMLFFFILVRWTVPRFRYDQLMNVGWKIMFPLSLLNILITGIFYFLF